MMMMMMIALVSMMWLAVQVAGDYGGRMALPASFASFASVDDDGWEAGVHVDVTPSRLLRSDDWVTTTWAGIKSPAAGDWIGLYSPSNVSIRTTSPVKWRYLKDCPTHLSHGRGSFTFSIVNMRADVSFVVFRAGPTVVARSHPITFANYNEPVASFVSLTSIPGELRVSWSSRDNDLPSVVYGRSDGALMDTIALATTMTYTAEEMCGSPASDMGWRSPGLIHHAVLRHLDPGVEYAYRIGSHRTGWSERRVLKVPPRPSSESAVRFFVFGDMGTAPLDGSANGGWTERGSRMSTKKMIELLNRHDLVLHIGDLAYAVGYSAIWDAWLAQIDPISSVIPYQVAIGNHERDSSNSGDMFGDVDDSQGECGVPYGYRFPGAGQPQSVQASVGQGSSQRPWYSFDHGPVHILVISTEHDFTRGSEQFEFILADLARVDRATTPWSIVAGHRPMYVDSIADIFGHASERAMSALMVTELEGLFWAARVDLALWGHDHSYQRSCPTYQGHCVTNEDSAGYKAPVHLVVGAAGFQLSPDGASIPPSWLHNRIDNFGIGSIEATGTTLTFSYISTETGLVMDQFTLSRPVIITDDPDRINVASK